MTPSGARGASPWPRRPSARLPTAALSATETTHGPARPGPRDRAGTATRRQERGSARPPGEGTATARIRSRFLRPERLVIEVPVGAHQPQRLDHLRLGPGPVLGVIFP